MKKNDYLEILKKSYYKINEKEMQNFEKIITDEGLGKCKLEFNLYVFIFGWFYLLYRRMVTEAFGVLIASLLIGYIMAYSRLHPVLVLGTITLISSLLSGFCYYYLYLNKFVRDLENCGEHNVDINCMKEKSKPKISYVIVAILLILFLIWPWIFALVTGESLHK